MIANRFNSIYFKYYYLFPAELYFENDALAIVKIDEIYKLILLFLYLISIVSISASGAIIYKYLDTIDFEMLGSESYFYVILLIQLYIFILRLLSTKYKTINKMLKDKLELKVERIFASEHIKVYRDINKDVLIYFNNPNDNKLIINSWIRFVRFTDPFVIIDFIAPVVAYLIALTNVMYIYFSTDRILKINLDIYNILLILLIIVLVLTLISYMITLRNNKNTDVIEKIINIVGCDEQTGNKLLNIIENANEEPAEEVQT